jgi:hypothetical protein
MFIKNKKYKSEISEFILSLKSSNPKLENTQKLGRAVLWDITTDTDQSSNQEANNIVKQSPYVYF